MTEPSEAPRSGLLAAALLGLAACGVSAFYAGAGLPTSDEGVVLAWAGRLARGAVFYRDVDAYQMPGAAYLLAAWMSLVGEHVNAARWLAAGSFTVLVLGVYAVARRLMHPLRAAVCAAGLLSLKLLAWPAFSAYLYSDLALCLAIGVTLLLVTQRERPSQRRLFAAGGLTILCVAAKQNLGLYLGFATGLLLLLAPSAPGHAPRTLRARLPEIGAYGAGVALLGIPMLGYFALQGLLPALVESAFLRPFTGYLGTSDVSFLTPLAWWRLGTLRGMEGFPYSIGPLWSMLMNGRLPLADAYPVYWTLGEIVVRGVYTSVPVALALAFWRVGGRWRRGEPDVRALRLGHVAALAAAVVLSAFPRADWFHVVSVYPVVWVLVFALTERSRERTPRASIVAVAALLAVCAGLAAHQLGAMSARLETPRASLRVHPSAAWLGPVLREIDTTLAPGEPFFVYGHEAYYYFLAGRYFPWPFAQLYPGMVGEPDGRPLRRVLERDPPGLVIRGVMRWPGIPAVPSYAGAVDRFLSARYEADADFFRRNPPAQGEPPPAWVLSVLRPRAPAQSR